MKVQEIKLSSIVLTENTRKGFSKNDIADLKSSIESVGLIQPIGVKEVKGKYELIYGFRRLEAFKQLKRESIPAVIFADVDSAGLKIIENLQREDITPLELAGAIKNYQKQSKLTLTEVAKILGKSLHQVSLVNRLNDLIEPLQKLLQTGVLEYDTSLFVARFPENEQKEFHKRHAREDRILLNEAKEFFDNRTNKLKQFPWPLDKKFTALPQCIKCPDRSSQQNVLFPPEETPDDTCLNRACLEKKIVINLNEKIAEAKKNGKLIYVKTQYWSDYRYAPQGADVIDKDELRAATKNDKTTVQGIIVASNSISDIGQVHVYVHKKNEGSPRRSSGKKPMNELPVAEQNKRRIENYKRKRDLILFPMSKDIAIEINKQIKAHNFSKTKVMPVEALAVVAEFVRNHSDYQTRNKIQSLWSPGKDKHNLGKIFLMLITAATHYDLDNNAVCEFYSGSEWFRRLKEAAGVLGIDVKEIEKKIRPKYDELVTTLKERFIAKNKIDPEKPIRKPVNKR